MKMRTWLLLGLVEEKVFIIDKIERISRGIWKSPEQRERVAG